MRHEPANSHPRLKSTRARRILVVDDNPDFRNAVTVVMQRLGYTVETAVDGSEALERMRRQRPDAVIIDLLMPNTHSRSGRESRRGGSNDPRIARFPASRNGTAGSTPPGTLAQQPKHGGLTALMATVDQLLSGVPTRR